MVEISDESRRSGNWEVDFAIITAKEIEAKAIVSRLKDHSIERFESEDIRSYHCGVIPIVGSEEKYRVVVVTLPRQGETAAANAATDTITRWKPRFVLMVGIAGGMPKDELDLGDVVVTEQVIGYEYGKVTAQSIESRDRVYPVSTLLLDRIRNFWDESWKQQVKVVRPENAKRAIPGHFVGSVASGNKVIASTEFRTQLLQRWPQLLGVEMEGEGFLASVFDRPSPPAALVIRGISDMADERKSDEWQEYAANAAAGFVESFLRSGPVDPKARCSRGFRPSPFINGRPVIFEEFINRNAELQAIFNRIRKGESTAIVGEPHIGKTSLLMRLTDKRTQLLYLGDDAKKLFVSDINLQQINSDFSPTRFWEGVLEPLKQSFCEADLAWRVEQLAGIGYTSEAMKRFFGYLDEYEQRLIILLDEFELLLNHPRFQEFSFYATLRAVTQYRSCSVILASRASLAELQQQVHELPHSGGSPVFNHFIEMRLLPFENNDVDIVLDRARDRFSPKDRDFIRFVAGRHPYLVQALADNLWETVGRFRYKHATERFCSMTQSHFDGLWCRLRNQERTTVIVLGLVECGKCRPNYETDYLEIEGLSKLGARLRDLQRLGLADRVYDDWHYGTSYLTWGEERWTLRTRAFVCWVYEVVIAGTHHLPAYDEWLQEEGFASLLTLEQWQHLVESVSSSIESRICDIGLAIQKKFE